MTLQEQIKLAVESGDKIDLYKLAEAMNIKFSCTGQKLIINSFQPENFYRYDTRVILASRRMGKSFVMCLVNFAGLLKPFSSLALIAPSYQHSKRNFQQVVEFTTRLPNIKFNISKSDYTIEVPELQSKLMISSSTAFQNNLVGNSFTMISVDEAHLIAEDDMEMILNLLTPTSLLYGTNKKYGYPCKNSSFNFFTTPRGKLGGSTLSNIFLDGKLKKEEFPNILSLALPVSFNETIDETFLELERKRMSASLFAQEYLVEYAKDSTTVFTFDETIHTINDVDETFIGYYTLILGIDIGYRDNSACAFVLYNEKTDTYQVIKELSTANVLQDTFLDKILEIETELQQKYKPMETVRFCDPSAVHFRAMAMERKEVALYKAKNERNQSIDYINTLFETRADGSEPLLYIHNDCKELKRELMICEWKDKTLQETFKPDPTGLSHFDMIDALRYALFSFKYYNSGSPISS